MYTCTYHTYRAQVFIRAMQGCLTELQTSMGAAPDLSPAWIMAAAKHFAARLDMLSHMFLLQPQLAADVLQRGSMKSEQKEMVTLIFFISDLKNNVEALFDNLRVIVMCFSFCRWRMFWPSGSVLNRSNFWLWRPSMNAGRLWTGWSYFSRVWTEPSARNTVLSVVLPVFSIWPPSGV